MIINNILQRFSDKINRMLQKRQEKAHEGKILACSMAKASISSLVLCENIFFIKDDLLANRDYIFSIKLWYTNIKRGIIYSSFYIVIL